MNHNHESESVDLELFHRDFLTAAMPSVGKAFPFGPAVEWLESEEGSLHFCGLGSVEEIRPMFEILNDLEEDECPCGCGCEPEFDLGSAATVTVNDYPDPDDTERWWWL